MMFKIFFRAVVDAVAAACLIFLLIACALLAIDRASAQTYIKGPALVEGVTQNTGGGAVALSNTSQTVQSFSGGTFTLTLPNATTLPTGKYFYLVNRGGGQLTVNDFGANTLRLVPVNYQTYCELISNSSANGTWHCSMLQINLADASLITGVLPMVNGGTGSSSIAAGIVTSNGTVLSSVAVLPIASGGTNATTANTAFNNLSPMTTGGDLIYGGASGVGTRLANGTAGQILSSQGGTNAPQWVSVSSLLPLPTVQEFKMPGSTTYTTPANVRYIVVEMVGGGAGGAGSGTANASSAGGDGTATTFGTSLLTAGPGLGAGYASTPGDSGAPTVNAPAIDVGSVAGGRGGGITQTSVAGILAPGGNGGSSCNGGAGGGSAGAAGLAAKANTGSGGAGGGGQSTGSTFNTGSGGAAGACVKAKINSPSASYSVTVGSAGAAGSAGTGGNAGGAGSAGRVIVWEYY